MEYFDDDSGGVFLVQRSNGETARLSVVNCARCAAMVVDTPTNKEVHESFHRGWWVEYQEADRQQMLKDYDRVYPGLGRSEVED